MNLRNVDLYITEIQKNTADKSEPGGINVRSIWAWFIVRLQSMCMCIMGSQCNQHRGLNEAEIYGVDI